MGKLVNLLRWKKPINILDREGNLAKDEKGKPVIIWMRIIGDEDQQTAYRMARIKSAEARATLRDETSSQFKDEVLPIKEADRDVCVELIKISKSSEFTNEALANVVRPDAPKLEEIAIDADAPTLEEQEKFDALVKKTDEDYQKAITTYIEDKVNALDGELKGLDIDTVRLEAMAQTTNAMALGAFLSEVQDEKLWRAVYMDEACTIRAFDSIDEFKDTYSVVKDQIRDEYSKLEMSPEDIKN